MTTLWLLGSARPGFAASSDMQDLCGQWLGNNFAVVGGVFICLAVILRGGEVLVDKFPPSAFRLRRAIARGEIEPWYQPVVCAESGVTGGVEVLARHMFPGGSVGMPASFIPLAEQHGLLIPLMCSLIREVCRDMSAMPLPKGFRLSVNLSTSCLRDHALIAACEDLHRLLATRHAALTLELTEHDRLDGDLLLQRRLGDLRAAGMHVALDDFGTGWSGLAALAELPVDYLKLDAVFIRPALVNDDKRVPERELIIIRHLKALANSLGIMVVAEGVEDSAQRNLLLQEGINWQQGYLHGRPQPADRFRDWMLAREGDVIPVSTLIPRVPVVGCCRGKDNRG